MVKGEWALGISTYKQTTVEILYKARIRERKVIWASWLHHRYIKDKPLADLSRKYDTPNWKKTLEARQVIHQCMDCNADIHHQWKLGCKHKTYMKGIINMVRALSVIDPWVVRIWSRTITKDSYGE